MCGFSVNTAHMTAEQKGASFAALEVLSGGKVDLSRCLCLEMRSEVPLLGPASFRVLEAGRRLLVMILLRHCRCSFSSCSG